VHSDQKKPKQGGQKIVVRFMAILLVLMFVLGLSSQIILYAGAEDLGSSRELKARHAELSREREDAQQELDAVSGQDHSAADRYKLTASLEELTAAQIEIDQQLEDRFRSECKTLHKALDELLTAVKDKEVVLECGQDTLNGRLADVKAQLSQVKEQLDSVTARLQEERFDLESFGQSLEELTQELSSDGSYQRAVQKLSETDEDLEEDILAEDTKRAVKLSPLSAADSIQSMVRGKKKGSSGTHSKIKGSDVVEFAVQFVGMPYKWGGESLTEGCDCSGFIKSVFSNFNVELPHFSGSLQHSGEAVEYEDARLGDLICYDGHVGIYMGNDKMVNAFDSKHGIIICSVNVSRLVTVRRII
jgi:cell wall-associated NlpC family hydrolase